MYPPKRTFVCAAVICAFFAITFRRGLWIRSICRAVAVDNLRRYMALGITTTFERQIAPAREIFFLHST
jgi:hypothetical protein